MHALKSHKRKSKELIVDIVNQKYEIDKANSIKQSKDLCTKLSIHNRDRCFMTQDSFLFLFVDEILDNNMVLCRIIHLRKFDSLFKRPCDSKILTFANSVEQVLWNGKWYIKTVLSKKWYVLFIKMIMAYFLLLLQFARINI